jgi:arylsulfatase A-like enzyme
MLRCLVGALLGLAAFTSEAAAERELRPNILVIVADDHACPAVSAYGSGLNQTPNIDRLAREGMRLDRYYVTNAICGPSRAVMLTGKYSHINGFRTNLDVFNAEQPTLPKMLQRAGYATAVIGKWHLVSDPLGFDHWEILPGQGRYYKPEFYTANGKSTSDGYVTDVITDKALAWLEKDRAGGQPFFLLMQHNAPHRPWMPGPAHVGDLRDATIPEPETLDDDYAGRGNAAKQATMRIATDLNAAADLMVFDENDPVGRELFSQMSPRERAAWKAAFADENAEYLRDPPTGLARLRWIYQRYLKNYLRCVASIDESMGRMLNYLDEHGLAENTIVIYASDQGFFLGEHGWYDKRFMYEPSLRAPCLVRWPKEIPAATNCDLISSNVDVAPSLLEAAGMHVPSDMHGRSLLPILRGERSADWRKSFYYHFYEGPPYAHSVAQHEGITTGRHKLIHFYTLNEWELYDLESDPHEMTNRYDDPQYAEVRKTLHHELECARSELHVPPLSPADDTAKSFQE